MAWIWSRLCLSRAAWDNAISSVALAANATAGNDRVKEMRASASSRSMKWTHVACVPLFLHCNCTHHNVKGQVLARNREMHALHSASSLQPQCRILAESSCTLCHVARCQHVAGKGCVQARAAQVGTWGNLKDVDWTYAGSRAYAISDTAQVDICTASLEHIWVRSSRSAQGFWQGLDMAHMSCVYGMIMFNVYRRMGELNLCPVCKNVSAEMIQILMKAIWSWRDAAQSSVDCPNTDDAELKQIPREECASIISALSYEQLYMTSRSPRRARRLIWATVCRLASSWCEPRARLLNDRMWAHLLCESHHFYTALSTNLSCS